MKTYRFLLGLLLLFFSGMHTLSAQSLSRSVIGAAGSLNPALTSTVGETVVNTGDRGDLILSQGFQQPPALVGTFVDPLGASISFRLYPNPSLDMLTLELSSADPLHLKAQIIDARGRMVSPERVLRVQGIHHSIWQVESLAIGTYQLVLRLPNGQIGRVLRFQKIE